MTRKTYSVFDSKARAFIYPFPSTNHATAVRSFEQAVQTQGHDFQRFAEDYTLFYIGEFNEETAEFAQPATPEAIVKAIALLAFDDPDAISISEQAARSAASIQKENANNPTNSEGIER